MHLTRKSLSGCVNSLSLVDRLLTQQGFKRRDRMGLPSYDMRIEDVATSCVYCLIIPLKWEGEKTSSIRHESQYERTVRIGNPYFEQKKDESQIPASVKQAAEHKIAEIADYLKTSTKKRSYSG